MTVAELIEKLSECDENAIIYVPDPEGGYGEAESITWNYMGLTIYPAR